jgi:DUF4097 and DUF4098 domain-containing protein YvlB
MTYKPHITPVLVLAGMLLASGSARAVPGDRVEKEEKSTVPAKGKIALVIKNARGRTVVVGRPDATSVSIVGVKTVVARDSDDATKMMGQIRMDVEEKGDQVVIDTQDDNKYEDWGWSITSMVKGNRRSSWIDYTIEVPMSFHVEATSGDVSLRGVGAGARCAMTSGDLEASDIGGDMTVGATSGNVKIDNVRGKLEISGTSGDFTVSQVQKDINVQLTSGDFVLQGCTGDVVFRSASGDARMSEVGGSVDASSSSGDISVGISPVGARNFAFSSSSGDIDISYVPAKDYGFHLDVSTNSGSIEGDMPIKLSKVDRRRLQGVVGTGAAKLQVETASGDVSIVEKSDAAKK